MTKRTHIRFDFDRRGRKMAFRQSRHRWWRMPLAEAELLEASGRADSVMHGPSVGCDVKVVERWTDPNGVKHMRTARVA